MKNLTKINLFLALFIFIFLIIPILFFVNEAKKETDALTEERSVLFDETTKPKLKESFVKEFKEKHGTSPYDLKVGFDESAYDQDTVEDKLKKEALNKRYEEIEPLIEENDKKIVMYSIVTLIGIAIVLIMTNVHFFLFLKEKKVPKVIITFFYLISAILLILSPMIYLEPFFVVHFLFVLIVVLVKDSFKKFLYFLFLIFVCMFPLVLASF